VHQDGLVHVSQLADRFVKNPAEVVRVQQKVTVTVTEIDLPRKRIALSMKSNPEIGGAQGARTSPATPRSAPQSGQRKPSGSAPVDWFTEALRKGNRS
jgi:protein Tex